RGERPLLGFVLGRLLARQTPVVFPPVEHLLDGAVQLGRGNFGTRNSDFGVRGRSRKTVADQTDQDQSRCRRARRRIEQFELGLQILARVQRLAVETTEQINRFEQRVQAEKRQAANGRQKSRVEKAPGTPRERGLQAEKRLEQRRNLDQA